MSSETLRLALIHDAFPAASDDVRLRELLSQAAADGATLAALPEIPVDPWYPEHRERSELESESPGGERETKMAQAASDANIGLLGGLIVNEGGRLHNRALLFDSQGQILSRYDKLHLPSEPGYYESDHYEPGDKISSPSNAFGVPIGIQLCSDLQRPTACCALVAMGAELILHPRATPASSYPRWQTVLRATAITNACWVVSINRPGGAPSIVIDPFGEVVAETTERLTTVEITRDRVAAARLEYPGYLASPAALYARSWGRIAP